MATHQQLLIRIAVAFICATCGAAPVRACTELYPIPSGGPCSRNVTVSIEINSIADVYGRLSYPKTTTVYLMFGSNLTLTSRIILNASFACSILQPLNPSGPPIWIKSLTDYFVPLAIYNTSNVYVSKINIDLPYFGANQRKPCPNIPESGLVRPAACAAIHVYNSYGVLVHNSVLNGRLDIYRTYSSSFNNLTVYNPSDTMAAVRFGMCGNASNLVQSNVYLTNSEIYGGDVGIVLHWEAIGVQITDNYIHNYTRFGITCGWGASYIADCFYSNIARNLLVTEPWKVYFGDGAAIYFNSKWHNPVNYVNKNYAIGGQSCVYYDWASSGVLLDGIVCIGQWNGFKINNGKFNNVKNALLINIRQLSGWISCQNWDNNNCLFNGRPWVDGISKFVRSDLWYAIFIVESSHLWTASLMWLYTNTRETANTNFSEWGELSKLQNWPRYRTICSLTSIDGVPCNPDRNLTGVPWNSSLAATPEQSGNCSGLPTESTVDMVMYNMSATWTPVFRNCNSSVPTVPYLNKISYALFNRTQLTFDDPTKGDYGISNPASPIYQVRPNFQAVKRSEVGPKLTNEASFFQKFNIYSPYIPYSPS